MKSRSGVLCGKPAARTNREFEDSKPMRMCMLIDAKDVGTICEDVQEMFFSS